MKIKRTITVEFDHSTVNTARDRSASTWCEACGSMTEFLSQHEATQFTRMLSAQGLRLDRQALHFFQNNQREILVCINSMVVANTIHRFGSVGCGAD